LGVRAVVGNVWEPRPRTLVQVPAPGTLPFLVFRNPRALPRWFVPASVEAIERPALDRWIAGLADPGKVAVFRDELTGTGLGAGAIPAPAGPPSVVAAARPLAAEPGRALLAVPGAGVRLLATSLPGPAGWRARAAGGGPLAELTVDGAFLGVVVPAGVSRVELAYRPPGLVAGTALGLLALLVVLALAAVGARATKAHALVLQVRGSD
ncbi:MAG: YfhO family protein, partial [Acidobacteria bacterium]|nr:YfhO family protein [Acidobacteriota bacterium]